MELFISIIVFVLGLGVVICLHEAGHFSMAKLFKVYCEEFSIGFGPKLISINPKDKKTGKKKWETTLNLRALPLGGYVSMVGESDDAALTEAGIGKLPKERTFSGVSHPKQAVIMVAGIAMNLILSYFLFFFGNFFSKQMDSYTNRISVVQTVNGSDSPLYQAGLRTGDRILTMSMAIDDLDTDDLSSQIIVKDSQGKSYDDNTIESLKDDLVFTLSNRSRTVSSYTDIDYVLSDYVFASDWSVVPIASDSDTYYVYYPVSSTVTYSVELTYESKESDGSYSQEKSATLANIPSVAQSDGTYAFGKVGITYYESYVPVSGKEGLDEISWESLGRSLSYSFVMQGSGIADTYIALGKLFTPSGYQQVGSIISVFVVNEQAVSLGAYYVLYIWGLISINLAVLNLLPIPGLDGWQLLLCIIEGVTHKTISKKFKERATIAGFAFLLVFGIAIIILDIIRLV